MKGNDTYKSSLGAIISIGIIGFTAFSFILMMIELNSGSNPNIVEKNLENDSGVIRLLILIIDHIINL